MKNLFRYAARGVALAALGLVIPFTSHAFLITADTVGDEFTVEFLLEAGEKDGNENTNSTGQDLSAKVIFTHLYWDNSPNTLSLLVDVTNTSLDTGKKVGLWKFAFGMNPTAQSVIFTHVSGSEKFRDADLSIFNPIQNAVLDLTAGAETGTDPGYACPPNNAKGCTLNEQEQQLFRLDFTFSDIGTGVEFSPFGSFWQTNPNSFQFGDTTTTLADVNPIPEPATLGLLGLGMLAMGALRRRKVALKG